MTYMLPPLNALRAFEAAARHLSFKLAAHELHVTPGAVSQQVKALEERLGARLFDRLHKQLVLTPAGQTYLPEVREAFRRIAGATAQLKSDDAIATLNVGVHAEFDFEELRADLRRFRRSRSRVGVRISQPAGLRELVEGKVDLVIVRGVERHPGYRCDRLGSGRGLSSVADYLVCPQGTADCPEIAVFRSWLLAARSAELPESIRGVLDRV
jgi:LysR family glycine cleavage system transcriptional activator